MQNMLVTFQVDPSLIYGGSTEPAALVELRYAAGGNILFSTSVCQLHNYWVAKA